MAKNKKGRCPSCGGDNIKADEITIRNFSVPIEWDADNEQWAYNELDAETCDGWDFNQESHATCADCKAMLEIDGDGGIERIDRPKEVSEK